MDSGRLRDDRSERAGDFEDSSEVGDEADDEGDDNGEELADDDESRWLASAFEWMVLPSSLADIVNKRLLNFYSVT